MIKLSAQGFSQIFVLLILVVGILASLTLVKQQSNLTPKADSATEPVIVVLNDYENQADVSAVELTQKHKLRLKEVFTTVKGFSAEVSADKKEELKKDPKVKFVSEDREVKIAQQRKPKPTNGGGGSSTTQTLPKGVDRIDAELNSNKGTGVGVAIIDTGIELNHPDLKANIAANKSCISGIRNGNDDNGHGTHVAGVVGAINNNSGVVGAAPDVKLLAVKVLNSSGTGTWSNVICGIDWVVANASRYNIKVINMSIVSTGSSDNSCGNTNFDALHQAICRARDAGITFVAAAGNEGVDTANIIPASYDDAVITVSGLIDTDGKSGGNGETTPSGADDTFIDFSNYGAAVDLAAPGYAINSTFIGGGYGEQTGTSMAAPHVSAAAALYLRNNPMANWEQVKNALISNGEGLNAGHTDPLNRHNEPVVKAGTL